MDEQRALLDQLMGKARNLTDDAKKRYRDRSFHDRDVCKLALCGMCPYSAFINTRSSIGRCPKPICEDHREMPDLRADYERASVHDKDDFGYEWDLFMCLDDLVNKCDKRIRHQMRELDIEAERDLEGVSKTLAHMRSDMANKSSAILALLKNSEFDAVIAEAFDLEYVRAQHNKLEVNTLSKQSLVVCPVSGNLVDLCDSNIERLKGHFAGRQYTGWKEIRRKWGELKSKGLVAPIRDRDRDRGRKRRR